MKPIIIHCLLACLIFINTKCIGQELKSPIDQNATLETKLLYNKLFDLQSKHILFGHQDAMAYGVNWKYEPNRSDIHDIMGEYPAVMGWDIGRIEHKANANLDNVPFDLMREYIIKSAKNGSINTISWHLDNPSSNGDSWDTTIAVKHILPNGIFHNKYKSWLDQVALFMNTLKFEDGSYIPILFRPFHELNGNWFWWGRSFCSKEEYIDLWKFTIHYLKEVKKLHHLLYVYNTNSVLNEEEFLERYPGDDFVDMISFDIYQFINEESIQQSSSNFKYQLINNLEILQKVAKNKNKLMAIGETGFETIPQNNWWTDVLYRSIKTYDLSYVLLWRNHGPMNNKMHYYAPYKNHPSSENFKIIFKDERIILQQKLKTYNIYNKL